ncbi:MAG TPA: glycosyltransferase [Pirellulaceae bacterium]
MTDKPFISVIVPLPDHRGHALEAISSWTQQSCSRSDYEIVVVIDGREPDVEAAVAGLLSPRDQFVRCEEGSLHDCYNAGAQTARGRVLLFTESHVKADRDCIAEIIARFAKGDVDALAVASGGINESRFAGQEQVIYEEALDDRIAGGWNLCTVRGCAIEQNAFHRAGGFRGEYGHFSEILLGAMLRHNGARLSYAERARVWHFNSGTFAHFGRELRAYGADEIRFRADNPNSPLLKYIGPSQLWENRQLLLSAAAGSHISKSLWTIARALIRGRVREVGRTIARAIPWLPMLVFGPHWESLKGACSVAGAALLLWVFNWNERGYYGAFRAMWNAQIHRGRALEVARQLAAARHEDTRVSQPAVRLAKAA